LTLLSRRVVLAVAAATALVALAACTNPTSTSSCQEALGIVRLLIEEGDDLQVRIDEAEEAADAAAVTALRRRLDDLGFEVAVVVDERPSCFSLEMRADARELLDAQ